MGKEKRKVFVLETWIQRHVFHPNGCAHRCRCRSIIRTAIFIESCRGVDVVAVPLYTTSFSWASAVLFHFFFSSYWQIDGRPVKRNRPLMLPPPLATTVWPLHLLSARRRRMEAMVNIDMFSPLSTVLSLFDYGEVGTKWGNFFLVFSNQHRRGTPSLRDATGYWCHKKNLPHFFSPLLCLVVHFEKKFSCRGQK